MKTMIETMWRKFLGLTLLLVFPLAAIAATTTTVPLSNTVYTDLGAGPMILSASGGNVVYQISDTQPALGTAGLVEKYTDAPVTLSGTAHVWGLAATVRNGPVSAIVTSGAGVVAVSNAGGSTAQGPAAAASSAWPIYDTLGGLAVSNSNPLPVSVIGGSSGGSSAQGTAAPASGAWPMYETVGGAAVSAANGSFVNPANGAVFPVKGYAASITQTVVTLTANTSAQLVAANPTRKGLRWMVVGTNPATIVPGLTAAVVGQGVNYSGSGGAGQQGGSEQFDANAVPTNAFQAISASGTTIVVWELN